MLRDYEIDTNAVTDSGQCLLHLLIQEEDLDMIDLLLNMPSDFKSKKPDPNQVDKKYNWTPLVMAINQGAHGLETVILSLLKAHADTNLACEDKTPVQWAASMN